MSRLEAQQQSLIIQFHRTIKVHEQHQEANLLAKFINHLLTTITLRKSGQHLASICLSNSKTSKPIITINTKSTDLPRISYKVQIFGASSRSERPCTSCLGTIQQENPVPSITSLSQDQLPQKSQLSRRHREKNNQGVNVL